MLIAKYILDMDKLELKYTQKYDYQCAKYKDPQLNKDWFKRAKETIEKYGII